MADGFGAVVKGVKDIELELAAMDRRVDLATISALKKSQAIAKTSIKSGMRGRPRWDHRGASSRTGEGVKLRLTPHHVTKNGGPGKLTGALSKEVGGVKRPKKIPGGYKGGVGVGGPKSSTNLYRKHVEAKYPYFAPGVKKAEKKMPIVWETAWAKAINPTRR